ncbi:MAG TPA: MFS transporter [Bacteroidetes bacterium]|nr:MFS transporter [Bacteroidota bacterium]
MFRIFHKTFRLYRDAYSGHPPAVWTLAILTFINRFGTMVIPFLTVYLTTILGFTFKEAGTLAAAFGFGSLGGSYLGGKLHGYFGTRFVISASLISGGFFLFLLQFATTFSGIWGLIFLAALFGESYRPAMSLAIGEHVPKNESGRSFSLIRLSINLGMAAAPAIGGFIAAYWGYRWLFILDGSTCILAGLFFAVASRNWVTKVDTHSPEMVKSDQPSIPPHRNRRYQLFLLTTFLMGFGFLQWFHTVPLFIKAEWGYDERYLGIMMAVGSLIIALFEMPTIHLIQKAKKINVAIRLGLVLIGLSFLPLFFPASLTLAFLAMTIMTVGEIFVLPFNNATQINMSPDKFRGTYTSWYWMTWSLVMIAGPWLGLVLIDVIGFSAFWLLNIGLIALSFAINFRNRFS